MRSYLTIRWTYSCLFMNTLPSESFSGQFRTRIIDAASTNTFEYMKIWVGPGSTGSILSHPIPDRSIGPLKFIKISYLGHFLFTKMFSKIFTIQNLTKGISVDKIKFNISILKNTSSFFVESNPPGSVTWLLFHHIFRSIQ